MTRKESDYSGGTRSNTVKKKEGETMMKRLINQVFKPIHREERGITGLETAIILIAFVVVAAVFAYTVLSAGLFSSQKGQEAVYAGLEETQSTLEMKGAVIAKDGEASPNNVIDQISFTVVNALGGEAIEFTAPTDTAQDGLADAGSANKVVINMVSKNWQVDNIYWSFSAIGKDDGDALLEDGEQFQITLGQTDGTGDLEDALSANTLTATEEFSIQVVPPSGATLVIERTLPAVIDDIINLN